MITLTVTPIPFERVGIPAHPLADLVHRMACEAAQIYAVSPWLAGAEKPGSWRDCMSDETAAAVEHLEQHGFRFVHEDA